VWFLEPTILIKYGSINHYFVEVSNIIIFSRPPALGIELRSGGWQPECVAAVSRVIDLLC
jgi:hypothetical protein